MKMLMLDGAELHTMDELHTYFSEKLELPEYYGRNLDALFDCLTDISEPVTICIDHVSGFLEMPGGKGESLLKVLERASEEQELLTCYFSEA